MEEITKELENLSDIEKIYTLKRLLEDKRKKIAYNVALKNLCFKK